MMNRPRPVPLGPLLRLTMSPSACIRPKNVLEHSKTELRQELRLHQQQQQHWQRAPPACEKKIVQETQLQRCTHLHLRKPHCNDRRLQMIVVTSLHHEAFVGNRILDTVGCTNQPFISTGLPELEPSSYHVSFWLKTQKMLSCCLTHKLLQCTHYHNLMRNVQMMRILHI